MPRHTCPSTNRVAPAGYATVNFRGWKASITDFGKWQKKPSEHNLHERQSSTSSIPYGECIATLLWKPHIAQSRSQWMEGNELCSDRLTATGSRFIERAYRAQKVQICSRLLIQQTILAAWSAARRARSLRVRATPPYAIAPAFPASLRNSPIRALRAHEEGVFSSHRESGVRLPDLRIPASQTVT